jgi:rubrerythrin
MNRNDILDLLGSLLKVEYDIIQAGNQALSAVDIPNIREQLSIFIGDHERHVSIISAQIREMKEQPFERAADTRTFFMEGFTPIRSMVGIEGLLQALENDINIINDHYSHALLKELPSDLRSKLADIYEDEQRHLQYIVQALNGRIWEPSETHLS